jgi:hypothetical protein
VLERPSGVKQPTNNELANAVLEADEATAHHPLILVSSVMSLEGMSREIAIQEANPAARIGSNVLENLAERGVTAILAPSSV